MKSKDVMKLLDISRSTLYLYVKSGKITGTKLHNGYYNYNEDSVFKLTIQIYIITEIKTDKHLQM